MTEALGIPFPRKGQRACQGASAGERRNLPWGARRADAVSVGLEHTAERGKMALTRPDTAHTHTP